MSATRGERDYYQLLYYYFPLTGVLSFDPIVKQNMLQGNFTNELERGRQTIMPRASTQQGLTDARDKIVLTSQIPNNPTHIIRDRTPFLFFPPGNSWVPANKRNRVFFSFTSIVKKYAQRYNGQTPFSSKTSQSVSQRAPSASKPEIPTVFYIKIYHFFPAHLFL